MKGLFRWEFQKIGNYKKYCWNYKNEYLDENIRFAILITPKNNKINFTRNGKLIHEKEIFVKMIKEVVGPEIYRLRKLRMI